MPVLTVKLYVSLQAAEAALAGTELDESTRGQVGHIASICATLAVIQQQADTILAWSRRALEYLPPYNVPVRTATTWTLGFAYQLQGDRAAARRAFTEAIAVSETIGHCIITLLATLGLAGPAFLFAVLALLRVAGDARMM